MTTRQQIEEVLRKANEKLKVVSGIRKERLDDAIGRMYLHLSTRVYEDCPASIRERKQKEADFNSNYLEYANRTFLNNERKGIDPYTNEGSLPGGRFYMQIPELLEAVKIFAENGDPLSIKIMSHYDELKDLQCGSDEAIYLLLNRKMTEPDYNDFLNGELAIHRCPGGVEVFLK